MINRVVLVGRLARDPEFRTTQSGISVTTFTLAVNRIFTNSNGERDADFINVVSFRKQAENVKQYLSKGQLAGVDGRLQSRSYENDDGRRIFVTEVLADSVQFLETRNNQSKQQDSYYNSNNTLQQQGQSKPSQKQSIKDDNPFANGPIDIQDDDLPF